MKYSLNKVQSPESNCFRAFCDCSHIRFLLIVTLRPWHADNLPRLNFVKVYTRVEPS
jgi:hypothetical protein